MQGKHTPDDVKEYPLWQLVQIVSLLHDRQFEGHPLIQTLVVALRWYPLKQLVQAVDLTVPDVVMVQVKQFNEESQREQTPPDSTALE